MKRVAGIGGIFFKSKDPKALGAWYKTHLGIDVEDWGGTAFRWKWPENPEGNRVEDLRAVLAALRAEGVYVEEKVEESEFGKFGWVIDPEGNTLELWQPPDGQ